MSIPPSPIASRPHGLTSHLLSLSSSTSSSLSVSCRPRRHPPANLVVVTLSLAWSSSALFIKSRPHLSSVLFIKSRPHLSSSLSVSGGPHQCCSSTSSESSERFCGLTSPSLTVSASVPLLPQ
ncbi:hypothetical protein HN51_027557, partial [Arachis hypogaea]